MGKKITQLSAISIILLIVNGWLFFSQPTNQSLSYDPKLFTILDTSAIATVKLSSTEFTNKFEKSSGWKLNNRYEVDPMFVSILMNVVSQVSISRSLSETELQEIKSDMSQAILVDIGGGEAKSFWVIGNVNRTQTYFLSRDQSKGYIAEIAGYSDYLGSIFELSTLQWRDRVILNGNWRSIQHLQVDYMNSEEDLDIRFNQDFFKVGGVAQLDSNTVVNYLGLFEKLQANERIDSKRFPRLDSLLQTEPAAIITMEDIYFKEPQVISIYPPISDSNIQLVLDTQQEPVIFNRRRLEEILLAPNDFRYEK